MPPMPLPVPDIPGFTLGGWQWWTDHLVTRDGWRVQRHVALGHHRTLDAANWRHAAGDLDHCRDVLDRRPAPPPAKENVVVLMHGLGRTRTSMNAVACRLRREGFDALNVGYASTREPLDAHAVALNDVLSNLGEYRQVGFVGHSMGNLVVRRHARLFPRPPWANVVMLAPPNQGSALASTLNATVGPVFRGVMGTSGRQIAAWRETADHLGGAADLGGRVGVVAAELAVDVNPLIGHGDGIVTLEETRLPGAAHVAVAGNHMLLMNRREVLDLTARFLRDGMFSASG